jgi:hypothetical protein
VSGSLPDQPERAPERTTARVRVAVPAGGLGPQLNAMVGWLNIVAGRGNFWITGEPHAAIFHFSDPETARAFINRFACGYVVQDKPRSA